MTTGIILSLAIALILVICCICVYNKLVKLRVLMDESWSIVDVFLKKRYDLVPNLVEIVKGYATHERETFEKVILARSRAMGAKDMANRATSENALGSMLERLVAVSESYPALRANENFMHLQQALSNLEHELEKARRYYNGTVRENNIAVETFPKNLIAKMFRFAKGEFYEAGREERETPQVSFNEEKTS